MTRLHTAPRPTVLAVLPVTVLAFPVMAAAAPDTAVADPVSGAWLLVIVIGLIVVLVTVLVLVYSIRLIRVFEENMSLFINALRARTPVPVVTISGEIPAGIRGQLDVKINGPPALPLEQVRIIISPPPGLVLDEDHIILHGLDTGGTKISRIGHGPARNGEYIVRITVLYRVGDVERVREFTRTVRAVIPSDPDLQTD